eukprot:CAMPEP_0177661254 /NCGR_PEP_ID=MMETSP0447-20121125/18566_1 /TAXON_ID=0 /ORGANISM="Stygamoeba regulata, Strain BSH-02190019" /LENGTH=56 /DNA_ID=CAMNT_0019166555 /DNA_START=87 /DNA_END=253 /DNA_ORIENTATION=+
MSRRVATAPAFVGAQVSKADVGAFENGCFVLEESPSPARRKQHKGKGGAKPGRRQP